MGAKLVLAALLGCGTFVLTSIVGAAIGIALVPPRPCAVAEVTLDWAQMPIDVTGRERGLTSRLARAIVNGGGQGLCETFADDLDAQRSLGATRDALRSAVDVRTHTDGESLVHFEVVAGDPDPQRALDLAGRLARHAESTLESYRFIEGLGHFTLLSREADRNHTGGELWWPLFLAICSDPVKITRAPVLDSDWSGTTTAAAICGAAVGIGATIVVLGVFALVGLVRSGKSPRHSQGGNLSRANGRK